MYSYDYPKDLSVGTVGLEISLKPFRSLEDDAIDRVVRRMFSQWKTLTDKASGVKVMLWTSDGSEILDYDGNIDAPFEWGRYIGIGNPKAMRHGGFCDERSLHVEPVLYTENPPVMHYRDLKRIIAAIKRIGKEMTGTAVSVGETFDPGPEFAYSAFKFERHTELNRGSVGAWIHCAGRLHAEKRRYAAYPDGIPEGTVFGEFLAKQFRALASDVGFDYLWLSNGFGFSLESWDWTGELFDGKRFNFDGAEKVRRDIEEFWDNYTPNTDFVTEVRGSNLSTAMDIAAHGCPIDAIYGADIIGPPNSPWAALDSRFGLEMVGYMSHIAEVPKNGYGFRYYTHDPWWINSPWFDRYGRSPHDIYLPLSVTRMTEDGKTEKPAGLNLLSVDDSFGDLEERCPVEVIPHLLEAYRTYPDAPGLVTWLYPFRSYCELGLHAGKPERMMMDDWFIESAIDGGFPLNTVVSDVVFSKSDPSVYRGTILVSPVPEAGSLAETCILRAIDEKIPLLLYGSIRYASDELKAAIGVSLEKDEIDGNLSLETALPLDRFETFPLPTRFYHDPLLSNGGLCEVSDGTSDLLAAASAPGKPSRAYAVSSKKHALVWIRGSFPYRNTDSSVSHLPLPYPKNEFLQTSMLMRPLLARLGFSISFSAYDPSDKLPLIFVSAHRGGCYFTAYLKDETIKTHLSCPRGVPILSGFSAIVENNVGSYQLPRWMHAQCRVFIRQTRRSKVTCRVETPGDCMSNDRRLIVTGLSCADLVFLPETGTAARFYLDRQGEPPLPRCWGESNVGFETMPDGSIELRDLSGTLTIAWQDKNTTEIYRKRGYRL